MKRILPVTTAVLGGVVVLADFWITQPLLDALGRALLEGVMIVGAFALLAGIINLFSAHTRRLLSETRSRGQSLLLLLGLLATLAAGLVLPRGALSWVFGYVYLPLQSTMAALLVFFAVGAILRTLQLRNLEAVILLLSSLGFLLLQMPWSARISPALGAVRQWLYAVPVTAGVRGMLLGIVLGIMATSLRILLAVDRPYAAD